MTQHELNILMACECMGWASKQPTQAEPVEYPFCFAWPKSVYVYRNKKQNLECRGEEWEPSQDIRQAMECASKIQSRGIDIWIASMAVRWDVWPIVGGVVLESAIGRCQFADLPRTICEVIEKSLGEKKEKP